MDHYLGRILVKGIDPSTHLEYEIPVNTTLGFPKRPLFAFVDAYRWVDEMNERNNIKSSGTTCEGYEQPVFIETINEETGNVGNWGSADDLISTLPALRTNTIFCHLTDMNGNDTIDEEDTLCILYVYNNALYAINAISGVPLFTEISLAGSPSLDVLVADLSNDNIPEIVAGNAVYDNTGTMRFNGADLTPGTPASRAGIWDFDRDGDVDSVSFNTTDNCVTIWSGRDTSLLYVYPFNEWTGPQDEVTVGLLAQVVPGAFNCYDVNASFPRYSVVDGSTVDLTVRVGNTGAAEVKNVTVAVFADINADRTIVENDPLLPLPDDLIPIGEAVVETGIRSGMYSDKRIEATLPAGTVRVWYRVDAKERMFERNEGDGVIVLEIE